MVNYLHIFIICLDTLAAFVLFGVCGEEAPKGAFEVRLMKAFPAWATVAMFTLCLSIAFQP